MKRSKNHRGDASFPLPFLPVGPAPLAGSLLGRQKRTRRPRHTSASWSNVARNDNQDDNSSYWFCHRQNQYSSNKSPCLTGVVRCYNMSSQEAPECPEGIQGSSPSISRIMSLGLGTSLTPGEGRTLNMEYGKLTNGKFYHLPPAIFYVLYSTFSSVIPV